MYDSGLFLPGQVQRDGLLIDCFTGERKNQTIKTAATAVINTRSFEKSVIARVLAAQFAKLSEPDHLRDALLHPAPAPELAELLGLDISTQARGLMWRGTALHSGDMLLIDGEYQLAKVFALMRDGSFLLIAQAHRRECEVFRATWIRFDCPI